MSDYVKSTDFASKDTLPSGDSAKIVRGTEIDAEFEALEVAIASKANTSDVASTYAPLNSPALTGSPTAPTPTSGDNDTSIATTAFVSAITGTNGINGFKNRIINGAMMIDQRNAGASIAFANNVFPVDRFTIAKSSTAVGTAQRSTTATTGFANSLAITCTTGASPSAAEYNLLWHNIEGFNVADLGWGTASAQAVTIGFWVRSSLTGTFAATVINGSYARGYTFNYTVSAANTWEFKTVTIPGDTSGTWATDNSTGIKLSFDLGSGSNSQGAAGAWGSVYYTTSGAQKVMATTGATFYITGVQLEKGSTATSFDYRPYGTELALCQRYYEATGFILLTAVVARYQSGFWAVEKRAAPTLTLVPTAGTSGAVANFTQAELKGFWQTAAHSSDANARVIGSAEL